jgi:hypothetical protein
MKIGFAGADGVGSGSNSGTLLALMTAFLRFCYGPGALAVGPSSLSGVGRVI